MTRSAAILPPSLLPLFARGCRMEDTRAPLRIPAASDLAHAFGDAASRFAPGTPGR